MFCFDSNSEITKSPGQGCRQSSLFQRWQPSLWSGMRRRTEIDSLWFSISLKKRGYVLASSFLRPYLSRKRKVKVSSIVIMHPQTGSTFILPLMSRMWTNFVIINAKFGAYKSQGPRIRKGKHICIVMSHFRMLVTHFLIWKHIYGYGGA